jgi:hypothetical protein
MLWISPCYLVFRLSPFKIICQLRHRREQNKRTDRSTYWTNTSQTSCSATKLIYAARHGWLHLLARSLIPFIQSEPDISLKPKGRFDFPPAVLHSMYSQRTPHHSDITPTNQAPNPSLKYAVVEQGAVSMRFCWKFRQGTYAKHPQGRKMAGNHTY